MIREIALDNPPVNALSFAYCDQLLAHLRAAQADPAVTAIVIAGRNGTFSAGADVNDFRNEPPSHAISVRDLNAAIEVSSKPFIAAIEGNALGGGLELALSCDYRIASTRCRLGLPEIKLGLLPGAGGTQRLPRLIGAEPALQMMLKGETIDADEAARRGLIDAVVSEGDVLDYVRERWTRGDFAAKRRISGMRVRLDGMPHNALPFVIAQAHAQCPPPDSGGMAAHAVVDAVQAAFELPFARGLARESRLFEQLARSQPSIALRHVFFAQRELAKIPQLSTAGNGIIAPLEIKTAGVVGGGTMGTGIAIAIVNAGIPVTVIEPNADQTAKARQTIFGMFMHQVRRGRLTQEEAWKRGRSIAFTEEYGALRACDLVIEAVFENLELKKGVFAQLDAAVQPDAILASNTSTLDVDAMAASTHRPEKVLGLHFFAPANIMKLLEIVSGNATSAQTLATAFAFAKSLGKIAVLSANAFGFIGNRMLFAYAREALALAEEGVPPYRIDAVMKGFGFAMGPFAMFDLSGVDVLWHIRRLRPELRGRTDVVEQLYAMGRMGQKSGNGFYRYEAARGEGREPIRDPLVEQLFAQAAQQANIEPHRSPSDAQIVSRLTHALVDAGAQLLDEKVALRPGDIDVAYIYGYGFPAHHGGPMWYGHEIGYHDVYGERHA